MMMNPVLRRKAPVERIQPLRLYDKPAGVRRLVEVKEACRYGGFPKTRCYELIRQGKIIAYKDGGRTYVDLDSIDRWHNSLPKLVL